MFKKLLTGLIVLLALSMSLAACATSKKSSTVGSANVPDAKTKTDPNATLRFIYANVPSSLDPQLANSGFANVPLFLIFDRLVHMDPKGEPVPGLAKKWTVASDGLSVTLDLREGVTFQDGTPFNADAVKLNIERGKTVPGSFVKNDLSAIASVETPSRTKVVLKLSQVDAGLILKLSDRAGAMMSPASLNAADVNVHPVGAGMYMLDGAYATGVKLKVKKWAGYWDKEAQRLGGVEISFITDTTAALNAVQSGTADAAYIRESEIGPAKAAKLQTIESYDLSFANILLNPDVQPALKDENVRMAINLAIDRKSIVDGVLLGYGKVTNQLFPPGYFAHSDKAKDYAFDPKKAKELLTKAGYPDGFELPINNVPGPGVRITEAVAQQLGKVGIKVTVTNTEAAALTQMFSKDKNIPAIAVRWTGRPDPTVTLNELCMPTGTLNPSGIVSDTAKSLFDQQRTETDPDKRAKLLQQLSDELVAHPGTNIVLFQAVSATAATKKVIGLQTWISGKIEFRNVGIAK